MKTQVLSIFILYIIRPSEASQIHLKSLSIRHLRKNDFGLIFDSILFNDGSAPKETLSFEVQSGQCCIYSNLVCDCDIQPIIGARISNLEPEKEVLATLIWPTLVLHDRVGNCTLNVVVHRPTGTTVDDSKAITFNTTINPRALPGYLLHYFNDMKKSKGYHKCQSDDLDPFQDCKPVNCELKYFGKRNFFDGAQCIPAKLCDNITPFYDYGTNECRSIRKVLSDDEIREMKDGKFTNWIDATAEDLKDVGTVEKAEMLKRRKRGLNKRSPNDTFHSVLSAFFTIIVTVLVVYFIICVLFYLLYDCCGQGCGDAESQSQKSKP